MKIVLLLVIISVVLNVIGQFLFKTGMNQIGVFTFSASNFYHLAYKLVTNLAIMSGLFVYVVSTVVWFLVLSRADLSFAYPLISIGYILSTIVAYCFLHETISLMRILGTFVIIIGVVLICQS